MGLRKNMEDIQYVPPRQQDLLLTDVKEEDLKYSIATELGVEFLSQPIEEPKWPLDGILFGHNYRPFVCMQVKRKSISRNVFFLVDTGSPHTYLSATTIDALGIKDVVPDNFSVEVHGVKVNVNMSPIKSQKGQDINVLGSDSLSRHKAFLEVDYTKLEVRIRNDFF